MTVFNSLGSNYSFGFALKSLFSIGSKSDADYLIEQLQDEFGGKTTLTYKGRHALELALRYSDLPANSNVAISGFTCYAVYRAVEKAGYNPVFVDVAKNQLHFGVDELQQAGDINAVIVQNTLGLPANISAIKKYCADQDILIIEDLAHSYGAVYEDGALAGTVGDLVMMSFSQDKQQDVVAGGALVDRRKSPAKIPELPQASGSSRAKNRIYPFLTCVIRAGYGLGIGKFVHFPIKKLGLLANPMSDNSERLADMTRLSAHLLSQRMSTQKAELEHRRTIASIYENELPKSLQYQVMGQPSYLRFPIHVKNPGKLIKLLAEHKIFISDTWYDSPIAPRSYMGKTNYKDDDCPRAESLSKELINLPTHQNISQETAREICAKIKKIEQEL